jgi:hypothetical protein
MHEITTSLTEAHAECEDGGAVVTEAENKRRASFIRARVLYVEKRMLGVRIPLI